MPVPTYTVFETRVLAIRYYTVVQTYRDSPNTISSGNYWKVLMANIKDTC
jgi:hypothetical protein